MESRQKSKISRDLEESHTDKEMAKFLPYDFSSSSVEPSESLAYRYNNSDYEKLKREHSRFHDKHAYLQGRMCEYINHENEVLRAKINNLKSQISSQDDANVESSESENNDNDNRPGKKRKVARCQIDQSDDDSETDEENARVILKMMPPKLMLRYDEKFTNKTNADILRQLIPRLIASMKPRFSPSYKQINDWLDALHKHRRA
ncbi:unnamed protein product [Rhizophagus irregularis]|nr:unnamed protein product [Rhizophagus irregularis]